MAGDLLRPGVHGFGHREDDRGSDDHDEVVARPGHQYLRTARLIGDYGHHHVVPVELHIGDPPGKSVTPTRFSPHLDLLGPDQDDERGGNVGQGGFRQQGE
jgi:hypothetical protein